MNVSTETDHASDARAMQGYLSGLIMAYLCSPDALLTQPVTPLGWDPGGTVSVRLASGLVVAIHVEVTA